MMAKKMKTIFIALAFCGLGSSVLASDSVEKQLGSWSIPLKACSIPFVPSYTSLRTDVGEYYPAESPPAHVFLARHGSRSYTAVLECYQGASATLNPPGFEYGPIPKVKEFTARTAETLFGEPTVGEEFNTYKMHDESGGLFELDLCFSKDFLSKYRVRSKQLRIRPDWVLVKKQEVE